MSDKKRVFITGRSALTAAGQSADTTWESIVSGQSGLGEIKNHDLSQWPTRLGGELKDFQASKMLPDRKLIKVISRQDVMGIHAAVQAVEHSQMIHYRDTLSDVNAFNEQTALYVGSPGNKYFQQYDFLPLLAKSKAHMQTFAEQLFTEVHPTWLLKILPNNVLAYAGITYGFKGPNHNVTNHAVGGTQALLEAYHAIQNGQAERAVVVAYDMALEPQALFYYDQLGVLSANHLKPFDKAHDGTVMAEGAAAFVLESEESAKARHASCYGEVLGGLSASEGCGLFSIDNEGQPLAQLIARTLERVELKPQDLGFVVTHGNGNVKSDDTESLALKAIFSSHQLPITSFKWAVGHTICASGLMDAVMSTYVLEKGQVPGIANFETPSAFAQDLSISAQSQPVLSSYGMLINRGFASMNTCVVIKACE